MVSIQASRFALLKVDDDFDDSTDKSKNKQDGSNKNRQQSAAKRKNKKKKKADESRVESDQLRNLAFGGSGKSGGKKSGTGGSGEPVSEKQWKQWQRVDEEFTKDEYEKDLQQALLQSQLEFEHDKQDKDTNESSVDNKKSRKKKKDKPASMSLEQFNQMPELPTKAAADSDDSDVEVMPAKVEPVKDVENPDPAFFDNVKKGVDKILHKERVQEEYRKQYAVESALSHQYNEAITSKDSEIEQLRKSNKSLKADLKRAKERSQQLCYILSQAEMKSKATILEELTKLQQVRTELNEQVTDLSESLEKERSKVHQLTDEMRKMKGGRHGGASSAK